ncbi:MAG: NUDIX domain-containing protein [Ruminococcus sp.]|uniref:NUDIX hydrolase n=1 Tax=Ruminococcus sp. TaxID=41978 RepID=UPI0025E73AF3|nr:NUDIX domain-containing protein [Ruminococcus sp.]MBO4866282.1 NUDIX domain-containing protein [Ruminococcus sp.]
MELWDLYDGEGKRTGEIWERKHGNFMEIPNGRYHLVSDILVQHKDGTFLLCKRHTCKDVYPGYWEASAGGSALQGETAEECARRELFEETGLKADSLDLINISFSDKSHSMVYCFTATVDCNKDAVILQESETTEYKWVDAAGLIEYSESDLAIKTSVKRYEKFYDKVRNMLK